MKSIALKLMILWYLIFLMSLILTGCSTTGLKPDVVLEPVKVEVPVQVPCPASGAEIVKKFYKFPYFHGLSVDSPASVVAKAYLLTVEDLDTEGKLLRQLLKSCGTPAQQAD